jgi:hypothetical protein
MDTSSAASRFGHFTPTPLAATTFATPVAKIETTSTGQIQTFESLSI